MQVHSAREQYIRWLSITRDLSPHTIRAYDGDLAIFERYVGGDAPIKRIDRDGVVAFIEAQRSAGLASTSIRRRASGLRGFCRWLQSRGLLDADPWTGVTVAAGRSRKLPRLVASHDLDRLVASLQAAAGVDDAPLPVLERPHESTTLLAVALMIATGVRVNEVVGIRLQDLDLTGRTVRIIGKGRRERQVFLTNDWLTNLTVAYLRTRDRLGVEHDRLLFNRSREPLTAPAMRSRLVKVARDASLTSKVTPHMLRHTAATQLIEAGVDIRMIQRLLGHASLTTTEIYTHVSDRALRTIVSEVDVVGKFIRC